MGLAKYDLQPQEKLAVSLYLKSMNKSQAAREAGYDSASVFCKPPVRAAVDEQLSIRAERLRIGGDWVLLELKRVYDRCMQVEEQRNRDGCPSGVFKFDAANALKALALIGKHTDVRAFEDKAANQSVNDEILSRLKRARQRSVHQEAQFSEEKQ